MEEKIDKSEYRLACASGDLETIKKYAERGGDLSFVFSGDHTGPMIAALYKHADVLQYLFEQRANFLFKNSKGLGVLEYAKGDGKCLKIAQKAVLTQQLISDVGLKDEYFGKHK